MNLGNSLFVLCGGKGTRLRTITGDTPKPLAIIGGRPFLSYQIAEWQKQGFTHFHFLLCYRPDLFLEFFNLFFDSKPYRNLSFEYTVEEFPLDTGGAIKQALLKSSTVQHEIVAVNADTYLRTDVSRVTKSSGNTLGLIKSIEYDRYGQIELDADGQIKAFREKHNLNLSKKSYSFINAGIYKLRGDDLVGFHKEKFSLEFEFFPYLVLRNKLKGVVLSGDLIDIGLPETFKKFEEAMKNV